ncbi:aldehyde reductase [Actinomadura craniellae]|uniref:Aldehyde reductase n=1 Tax=Actinomadura craniellae TaxID=2231787 RepID=A0A365GYL1_9ACTN|nr:aldehyde reductase [Actinomadura craniellae]RAY11902.1 aldehyde reductase [Actinomadura craniellae]
MDPHASKDLVLVTGGNGFVGSHVVVRLLRDGHRVRTTVRSAERAADVRAELEVAGVDPDGRLEIVSARLDTDDGWPDAVAGCTHVLHVASPFPSGTPADDDEVIVPARDGTLRVLRAARDGGVRRAVLTSSFAAIGYSPKPGGVYDETDWTDPADDNTAYIKSKTIAERAAWDFIAAEGGGLELAVVNPGGIFGPVLGPRLSSSTGIVKAMLEGRLPVVPPLHFGLVDVRDVADIHLRAMTHPGAAGERFLAGSGTSISFLQMARILAEHLGERAARVPTRELTADQVRQAARTDPSLRESVSQLGRVPQLNTAKARTMLGWTPRDPVATIIDTAESLYALGLVNTPDPQAP